MRGKIFRPSGACDSPRVTTSYAGTPARARPAYVMEPERGRRSPEIALRVVVLPAPLAPISVTISPSRISSDTPLIASMLP